jgi:hypothetical protein
MYLYGKQVIMLSAGVLSEKGRDETCKRRKNWGTACANTGSLYPVTAAAIAVSDITGGLKARITSEDATESRCFAYLGLLWCCIQ